MGGGKAGWDPLEWVPLCVSCHDWIDARTGGVLSEETCKRRAADKGRLQRLAERWWKKLKR